MNPVRLKTASAQSGSGTPARGLRVLQLTDTHLYADPNACLMGLNTLDCLERVLELAQRSFWPADMLLLTGDLVHDGSRLGYRRLAQRLAHLGVPAYSLPGNHDDPGTLAALLNQGQLRCIDSVRAEHWNFVFLDSTVPGVDGGYLGPGALATLERCLRQHPAAPTLVSLHHQPVTLESQWMDSMALANPGAFFAIVDRHPQVRIILWGHIHQAFRGQRNGVELLAAPSTCVQFSPGSDHFSVDSQPPGLRWLELFPDGAFATGIARLDDYPNPLDLSSEGY